MVTNINLQGKPLEITLMNLEEGKSVLVLAEKADGNGDSLIIYLDTDQITIQGLPVKTDYRKRKLA